MEKIIEWWKGLPWYGRILAAIPVAIVFIGGVVIGVWFGSRGQGVHSVGMGIGDSSVSGLATQIGRVESDAESASRQNTELGKELGEVRTEIDSSREQAEGIASDNRRIEQQIDGARKSADDLGKLLGIEKD